MTENKPVKPVTLDPSFVEMLVCPLTRSPLKQEGDFLVAAVGGLRYPILNGLPCLLIDRATLPEGIESIEVFKEQFKDHIHE